MSGLSKLITLSQTTIDRLNTIGASEVRGGYQDLVRQIEAMVQQQGYTINVPEETINRLKKYSLYKKGGGYQTFFKMILADGGIDL